MVAILAELPLERRSELHGMFVAMAEADGKATKSELDRLKKLRAELGLREP